MVSVTVSTIQKTDVNSFSFPCLLRWVIYCGRVPGVSQTLDAKPAYTEEELQRFEAELRDKEEELKRKAETLRQEQELLRERGKALEAQKREYQQVMSHKK